MYLLTGIEVSESLAVGFYVSFCDARISLECFFSVTTPCDFIGVFMHAFVVLNDCNEFYVSTFLNINTFSNYR